MIATSVSFTMFVDAKINDCTFDVTQCSIDRCLQNNSTYLNDKPASIWGVPDRVDCLWPTRNALNDLLYEYAPLCNYHYNEYIDKQEIIAETLHAQSIKTVTNATE